MANAMVTLKPIGAPPRKGGRYPQAFVDHIRELMVQGYSDYQIACHSGISAPTLSRWRKKFVLRKKGDIDKAIRKKAKDDVDDSALPMLEPLAGTEDQIVNRKTFNPAPRPVLNALEAYQQKLTEDVKDSQDTAEILDKLVVLGLLDEVKTFMADRPPLKDYADLVRVLNVIKDRSAGTKTAAPESRGADMSVLRAKPFKPTQDEHDAPDSQAGD